MTWDEVALRYGTDKASSHHGYMAVYEDLLGDARGHRLGRFLEIGVARGHSIAMWRELLPEMMIVGADNDVQCMAEQRPRSPIVWADAKNPADMWAVTTLYGPFDVIVDDGSHEHDAVRIAFEELFPRLRPGGCYFVEDLDGADPWVEAFVEQWNGAIFDVAGNPQGLTRPCLLVFRKAF